MEAANELFFFLPIWGASNCVTTSKHCIWYNFRSTKCFEATWRLMVVVPWSLLYITKPFQLWVKLYSTFSCCTLWHKMHFILWKPTSITSLKSLNLKNPHVLVDLCHVLQNFGWI
jgi:hypothetical protein